jgi:hypothetical protein
MDKTVGVSEHVYEVLEEVKEELDHTSFDSALRDVLNRAGLSEEGQEFTTITDYELSYYTEWVEDKGEVKKIEYEGTETPMYQHRVTGHKTYGPVPNELEMFGYVQGFEDGKSQGITYAWPKTGLANYVTPQNAGECSKCGTSLARQYAYFSAEFASGSWGLAEESVCSDCELNFPTSDENPQVVYKTRVEENYDEDAFFDYIHTDIRIVSRHYPDENADPGDLFR